MRNSAMWLTYLSGHMPIAIIYAISVIFAICKDELPYPKFFILLAGLYFLITFISAIAILWQYNNQLKNLEVGNGGTEYIIDNIQIKNLFTSDAMSYYVLPFAAFAAGDDLMKITTILIVLTVLFGFSFVKERMNLYTPILSYGGYLLLSCNIHNKSNHISGMLVLTKASKKLIFGNSYRVVLQRINDSTAIALIKFDD